MLAELIKNGFGLEEDYNCAEKILYGANRVYQLELSDDALKMASAFGGGMGIEATCGVITAGLMVIGMKVTQTVAHQSKAMRPVANAFLAAYSDRMGSINCKVLKENYKTEENGCYSIIYEGALILDRLIAEVDND